MYDSTPESSKVSSPAAGHARILVIDDNAAARTMLSELLTDEGHEVACAENGLAALSVLERFSPDLVITDLSMPHLDGVGFLHAFRAKPQFADVPVIVVSAHHDTLHRVEGFQSGADDFVPKPIDLDELLARIERHLQRARRQHDATQLSASDELTGMLNRRGLANFYARMLSECVAAGDSVSMVVADVDKFKSINDRFGHSVGDTALCTTARFLQDTVRATDRVGRIGGDEFVLLLPHADSRAAQELVRRVREGLPWTIPLASLEQLSVELSIGAATSQGAETFDALLRRADAAMYENKRARARASDAAVAAAARRTTR